MMERCNEKYRWNSQKVHDNNDETCVFQKHLAFFENCVCVCANAVARDQWNPSKYSCSSHCISLHIIAFKFTTECSLSPLPPWNSLWHHTGSKHFADFRGLLLWPGTHENSWAAFHWSWSHLSLHQLLPCSCRRRLGPPTESESQRNLGACSRLFAACCCLLLGCVGTILTLEVWNENCKNRIRRRPQPR